MNRHLAYLGSPLERFAIVVFFSCIPERNVQFCFDVGI